MREGGREGGREGKRKCDKGWYRSLSLYSYRSKSVLLEFRSPWSLLKDACQRNKQHQVEIGTRECTYRPQLFLLCFLQLNGCLVVLLEKIMKLLLRDAVFIKRLCNTGREERKERKRMDKREGGRA